MFLCCSRKQVLQESLHRSEVVLVWAAQKLHVVRPDGPNSVLQRCLHCIASCENVDSDRDKQDDTGEALIAGNNAFRLCLIGPLISSDLVQIDFFFLNLF